MDFLKLPKRTSGNRIYGLTSIADFGTPVGRLTNILDDYSHIIDIAKIGIGSAYITPNIKEKVNLYKEYKIKPYCGGTLFEKCFYQKKIPEYLAYLKTLGIEWLEVSNGTLDIPLKDRLHVIAHAKDEFNVIAEVGSKDCTMDMDISEWKEEMQIFLDAGCKYVITEGRDSGTAGIYQSNGQVKSELIDVLVKGLDVKKIIFEAPTSKHQMFFINQVGANVNLGNVRLDDVLALEAQRNGLRSETFYLEETDANYLNQTPTY